MADPTDLSDAIATEAVAPSSSSADGQSASGRPIGDIIKAQQFLDAKAAMKKRRRGVLFTKLTTPGAVSDCGGALSGTDTCGGCR